ncbi:DUF1007 family protein [Pseudodesulfovibrio thermohalotolerans]|uniref:DUF1007 family protein n=1 Tax=Pseudodesulfovibrio thermohalotolerans TaxID=2880651 RepID=UPI0024415CF2|nr:DUF1007 family protein [Pseudodesulfovibrio thermohalotolerans]WFS62138.1 DUF1007 family protein [Pseudodesulfovibrio thermohalotolerans]
MFASSPFRRIIPAVLAAVLLLPALAFAHPHAFVAADVTFVFDEEGLAGIHQRWDMDEMLTASILDLIQKYDGGPLTPAEAKAVESESFKLIKEYDYFTHIRIDGKPFRAQWATDFRVELNDRKMVWHFTIPCHVKAADRNREIVVGVFDESFYTFVTYASENGPTIDPTADPLYLNADAPASPDDFQRFSSHVKLGSFSGKIRTDGPTDLFELNTDVRTMPSMAYYYEQIVPEALIVNFRRP